MTNRWHLITGEYPPQPGGVADYSRVIARGLAAAGDAVTIWTSEAIGAAPDDPGISVRRLPGHFGPRALYELDKAIGGRSAGRVLLQYTPHAFGWKAMNFPFVLWVWRRARHLDVMFHEVAYPFEPGQPLKHKLLAASNRLMASLLLRAAERVFATIPAWTPLLRRLAARFPEPCWAPIPSNLPTKVDAAAVAKLRKERLGDWETGRLGDSNTASAFCLPVSQSPSLPVFPSGTSGRMASRSPASWARAGTTLRSTSGHCGCPVGARRRSLRGGVDADAPGMGRQADRTGSACTRGGVSSPRCLRCSHPTLYRRHQLAPGDRHCRIGSGLPHRDH